MDEEITIINSNTRNERIRNFFINNKKKIEIIIKLNWMYKLLLPPLKITIRVIINKKIYW